MSNLDSTVNQSANYQYLDGEQATSINKLFVYGALSAGQLQYEKIKSFIENRQSGVISGLMLKLKVGFPVIVANENLESNGGLSNIKGEVITVKDSEMLFSVLDRFHSVHPTDSGKSLFLRIQVMVQLENGQQQLAWCYQMNPTQVPAGASPINGMQWMDVLKNEKTLIEILSERQKTYILKLGKASGRETVPINDLSLYRELMNLELIVDKGRRLALSKLGNEVFRYLS